MHLTSLVSAVLLLGAADALPRSSDAVYHGSSSPHRRTIQPGSQAGVLAELLGTKPTRTSPTNADGLRSRLSSVWSGNTNSTPVDFYSGIKSQINANIGVPDILTNVVDVLVGPNRPIGYTNNINPRSPSSPIYPSVKNFTDPKYTVSEAKLRAAIQIPSSFAFGHRPPVILVPGTGGYGGENFESNILKILPGAPFGDAVWHNIPDALLDDAQRNAEYVAYAVNYISGISGNKNVSLITPGRRAAWTSSGRSPSGRAFGPRYRISLP